MGQIEIRSSGARRSGLLIRTGPVLMVVLWSTGFIGTKLSLPFGEPFTLLFWRFATTALVMVIVCRVMRVIWPRDPVTIALAALTGLFTHAAFLAGSYLAVGSGVSTGIVALVVGLQPIVTAIVAGPLLGERVSMRQAAGLLLGFCGIALVVWGKFSIGSTAFFGIGYAVLSLLGITAGTLLQKRFGTAIDMRSNIVIQYVAAALVTGVLAGLFETMAVRWTGEFLLVHLWLVFGCSIGAVAVTFALIGAGAVSRVASLFYLVAPLVAVMGYLMFDETLGLPGIAGMAIAVAGVALVVWHGDHGTPGDRRNPG